MTAERMPPSKSSLLVGLLEFITRLTVRYPWSTVSLAVTVAAAALLLSAARLEIRGNRIDLLNPESTYNRRWLRYVDEFDHKDDVVVVVEGSDRGDMVAAMDEIAAALALHDQLFDAVLYHTDLSRIRAKGLHYLSAAQLAAIDRFLDQIDPVLRGDWSPLNLGSAVPHLGGSRSRRADPAKVDAELTRFAASLASALSQPGHYRCPWPVITETANAAPGFESDYLLAAEGRFGFVLLRLASRGTSANADEAAIGILRGLLKRIGMAHPNVTIGLTGLPVMEQDEMCSSRTATVHASLLSLVGVTCLFAAGFGGLRHSLMTVITLALGIAWSIGYATLVIGHLNILSMAFGVILIGLGIDFGIHYLARYQQLQKTASGTEEVLCATVAAVGPGVVTGGLTTSIAFFTAGLTEFTGIAELGIIAGGGVLLCLLATLIVLPALLTLTDGGTAGPAMPEALALGRWIGPLHRTPRATLALSCGVTVALVAGLVHLHYDHNLLNLQPVGLESVKLERKLLAESDQSLWYALSIADDRDELLARKARFLELKSVERIEEIASVLPAEADEKIALIRRIHQRLAALPQQPPQIPVGPPQPLQQVVTGAKALAADYLVNQRTRRQLDEVDDLLMRLPAAEYFRRLADYQRQSATDLLAQLHALQRVSNPEPPQLADLPKSLVTRFVSASGRYLLRIYGKADIWDMDALGQFVQDVRRVDPQATGKPLQTYEASRQMQRSYLLAGLYSLVAVAVILVLDFRSLRTALLAMLPVAVGMLQMLGLLGFLGIQLNPANMIVLPLILGIGIDDGVHVVHDFKAQSGHYRLTNSTATAVLMSTLTSMVGFGSLMIASHRGLESLGRVLTIGVSCCLRPARHGFRPPRQANDRFLPSTLPAGCAVRPVRVPFPAKWEMVAYQLLSTRLSFVAMRGGFHGQTRA